MPPRSSLVLFVLFYGCAPRLREIALPYPAGPVGTDAQGVVPAAASAPLQSSRLVEVDLFVDGRRLHPVAETRDRSDRQTALIETKEPVGLWLRRGIEYELARAGIESVAREASPGAPLCLEGRVREAFASERFVTEARVSFHALLRCTEHGEVLLSRTYSGSAVLPEDVQGVQGEALGRALEQAARDLAGDVALAPACPR